MHLLKISYNSRQFYSILVFFSFVLIANLLTIGNVSGMAVTIPEIIVVLILFLKGDVRSSAFLHFCFILLGMSIQGVYSVFEGNQNVPLYDYASLKLFGPVRACYAINIILFFYCLASKLKPRKGLLLYKLFRYLSIMCVVGIVIGFGGFAFSNNYSLDNFIGYLVYMFAVLSTLYILLCLTTPAFVKSAYYCSIIAIMAGLFSSLISFAVVGFHGQYSVYDTSLSADVVYFAPLLIIGMVHIKEKTALYISILIFLYFRTIGISGKGVFVLAFAFVAYIYLVFKNTGRGRKSSEMWFQQVIAVLFLVIAVTTFFSGGISDLAEYKLESAQSMFTMDMNKISASPYIRIASLLNILYEGVTNPIFMLFGHGYGGYFEDSLNLFAGIELTNGGWSFDVVQSGRFTSGHDTIVTVPLFNGLIGLFLILKIVILYTKRLKYNFLNGAAFIWLLMVFYFNPNYAMIGSFLLLGAEYNVAEEKSIRYKQLMKK